MSALIGRDASEFYFGGHGELCYPNTAMSTKPGPVRPLFPIWIEGGAPSAERRWRTRGMDVLVAMQLRAHRNRSMFGPFYVRSHSRCAKCGLLPYPTAAQPRTERQAHQ